MASQWEPIVRFMAYLLLDMSYLVLFCFYLVRLHVQTCRQFVPTPRGSILHPPRASQVPYNATKIHVSRILGFCDFPYIFPIGPFKGLPIAPPGREQILPECADGRGVGQARVAQRHCRHTLEICEAHAEFISSTNSSYSNFLDLRSL